MQVTELQLQLDLEASLVWLIKMASGVVSLKLKEANSA